MSICPDMVSEQLRQIRTEKQLTREQVAAALGINARTVRRHEQGEAKLSRFQLIAYATYYGVPLELLIADAA